MLRDKTVASCLPNHIDCRFYPGVLRMSDLQDGRGIPDGDVAGAWYLSVPPAGLVWHVEAVGGAMKNESRTLVQPLHAADESQPFRSLALLHHRRLALTADASL